MIQVSFTSHSLPTLLALLAETTQQVFEDTLCRIDDDVIADKKNVVKLLEKEIVAKRAEVLLLK